MTYFAAPAVRAESDDDTIYYALDSTYEPQHLETRLIGGYDYSNPYLNLFAYGLGTLWHLDRTFAIGLEGVAFTATQRDSTRALDDVLWPEGRRASYLGPEWLGVGVLRFTPLSGMVNFFSAAVMPVDISLLLRGGMQRYRTLSVGPLIGTGLEVALRFNGRWGMSAALLWDGDKPSDRGWQSRVGFRVGPSLSL